MSVSAIFTLMTETREEAVEITKAIETTKDDKNGEKSKGEYSNLIRVPCIWYPITFRKKSESISALFNSNNEVNAIYPTLAWELELPIKPTDIGAQKIDSTMLDIYGMVVTAFSVTDKVNQVRFFEETFLMANISSEIVFGMPFLTFNSADVNILGWELRWRIYTTEKALPTTRCIELVGKKEFAAVALDLEHETYVVQVGSISSDASPSSSLLDVHLFQRPQISGLIAEEAFIKVLAEYSDFADVFSLDLASKLFEYIGINNHAIELVDSQQPPYRPIYSLGPVELETLKAYIETNLANRFIRPSKFLAGAPILFDRKSNGFFWLYVDY